MIKIKSIDDLKKSFEEQGYFGTEDIMIEAYLGLSSFGGKIKPGQDIRAVCLDGPPGSGKTSFVENYVEIYKKLSNEDVEFINYECNDTTGKSDLYEEINISSAIKRDADKILIEGCLTEAIRKVNEGKKVILLLDEFDKSRTETDVFFFKFLQSGEINTTQHGILRVKDEYKTNLQVFFCKNDLRELSGPLMRRTRSVKLECMTPDRFNEVARDRLLIQNSASFLESLINLVTIIYAFAYNNQSKFERIPSCSEMMIAISDAYDISTQLKTNSKQVYNVLLKRMFKDEDDRNSFLGLLQASKNEEDKTLQEFLSELEKSEEVLNDSFKDKIISDLIKADERINAKVQELDKIIESYSKRFEMKKQIEEGTTEQVVSQTSQTQKEENKKIALEGGKLVLGSEVTYKSIFKEEEFIKRGVDIFSVFEEGESSMIVSAKFSGMDHYEFISSCIDKLIKEFGFKVYENGILLKDKESKLVLVANIDKNNNPTYEFHVNNIVCPSTELNAIQTFCHYLNLLSKQAGVIASCVINIDGLIYNDAVLSGCETIGVDNVYHISHKDILLDKFKAIITDSGFKCDDYSKVVAACEEMKKSLILKK